MNFRLFLELFDSPVPVSWQKRGKDMIGTFVINNKQYSISILDVNNTKEIKFELIDQGKKRQDITGTGDELKVFSTVIQAIRDWSAKAKPQNFIISAREDNRQRLYLSMMRMLPKNWKYENLGSSLFVYNSLTNKNKDYFFNDDDDFFDF